MAPDDKLSGGNLGQAGTYESGEKGTDTRQWRANESVTRSIGVYATISRLDYRCLLVLVNNATSRRCVFLGAVVEHYDRQYRECYAEDDLQDAGLNLVCQVRPDDRQWYRNHEQYACRFIVDHPLADIVYAAKAGTKDFGHKSSTDSLGWR